jgi:prepilin-type processing-associated H-X9-DG protein
VELLVVIAIIGLLIALLLPAVQSARESGRNASCKNNLRQLALALLHHNDAFKKFPVGGVGSPSSSFYGHSWWVSMFPFLEEQGLYNGFDKTGTSTGTWYACTGWTPGNANNAILLNRVRIAAGVCPSSTLPVFSHRAAEPPAPEHDILESSYTGISGSSDHPSAFTNSWNGGRVSFGGVLVPKTAVRISQITDGTSKTMLVGEQSDYCIAADGTRYYCASNCGHGFTMGLSAIFPVDPRTFNLTTVRYAITKDATLMSVGGNCGNNSPLQAAHPLTANAAFADGSVMVIDASCDVGILKGFADRDDGR